ncbi:MAG TPA: M20/M25/M40 family metallo-hydrolase, partial [Candidatus Eisenbacteria bacterium]|nr:M20/M25/M40 family metallo-hydrolase [Candidatus Eisenbacteria bacterium]
RRLLLVLAWPALVAAVPAPVPDPRIAAAVAGVSAQRLQADDARLVAFGTRSTFSEKLGDERGVFAARAWIADQFRDIARASHGRMRVDFDTYVQKADGKRIGRDVEISSVIATLAGDEPGGRTYVMSSHYDSRNSDNADITRDAPGADDNGSGTAAVIEAARAMAALPLHATVIFATYDAEEQGLFGSAHHAAALKAAGVDVQGDLNNDIVGASVGDQGERNPGTVRIFSQALAAGADPARVNLIGDESDSPSRELARYAQAVGDAYQPDFRGELVFRADRFLRGGDHESFNVQGYAAIRFVEPVETFAHQHQDVRTETGIEYGDLAKFMDFDYLARVTRYNVSVLASLAMGPGRPDSAKVLTRALDNRTQLTWLPVPGAAKYEVVRRRTTDATWTDVTDVGSVTAVTLPYSKDNWLFGVRAVDAEGHAGVPAFPLPVR